MNIFHDYPQINIAVYLFVIIVFGFLIGREVQILDNIIKKQQKKIKKSQYRRIYIKTYFFCLIIVLDTIVAILLDAKYNLREIVDQCLCFTILIIVLMPLLFTEFSVGEKYRRVIRKQNRFIDDVNRHT